MDLLRSVSPERRMPIARLCRVGLGREKRAGISTRPLNRVPKDDYPYISRKTFQVVDLLLKLE